MKTFWKTTLITVFLLISISGIQAQTKHSRLNQVELMKQFIGTWTCELGKDTILISENKPFGTGIVCNSQIVTKGENIDSVKQLCGYDKKNDRFIMAELIKSSPVIEICNVWFTSKNSGEIVIINPDNASLKFRFEFKTPDMIVQTAIRNEKVVKEITLTRVKSNV
jgi:hypothetical protein